MVFLLFVFLLFGVIGIEGRVVSNLNVKGCCPEWKNKGKKDGSSLNIEKF